MFLLGRKADGKNTRTHSGDGSLQSQTNENKYSESSNSEQRQHKMRILTVLSIHFYLSMVSASAHRYNLLPSFLTWVVVTHVVTVVTLVRAENCTLCSDGSYPTDPQAKFTYTKNGLDQAITCDFGYTVAPKGEFANCTALHLKSSTICGCGASTKPKACNLCYLGEKLPNPTLVVANKSCAGWEAVANIDFASNCPVWQKTFGSYCGCSKNSTMLNNFCSLCAKPLPDPNAWVQYTDGTSEFCANVEVNLNTQTFPNCSKTQTKYRQACGCDKAPIGADGKTTSNGFSIMASLAPVFVSCLFLIQFLL